MNQLKKEADAVLNGALASGALAGAAAIAVNREGAIYEGDAGLNLDSVCWIASMTKALVSVAAVQLVERGAIALDAPVSAVLPALGEIGVLTGFDANGAPQLRPPKRAITLRHLLTHTSGFGYELFSDEVLKMQAALGLPSLGTGQNKSLMTPLLFDPGARWAYGIGIDWAGKVVEAVSGKTLGAYLKEEIFDPLGMTSTAFKITPDMRARMAPMHVRTPDGALAPFPFETPQEAEFESGGGGLYSTARDYSCFVRMILDGGAYAGGRVLSRDSIALLSSNQMGDVRVGAIKSVTPMSLDSEFFPGVEKSWSLAFQVNHAPLPTGRAAGGLMWAGLSNCYYWIDPASGVAGVFIAQLLPFADPAALGAYLQFETAVYDGLRRAV